jgi:selenide,water dikinase
MKMARASGVKLSFDSEKLPVLPGAYDLIEEGCIPGASFRNLKFTDPFTGFSDGIDYNLKMLAADAQTSGGILMCVSEEKADTVLSELRDIYPLSCVAGRVEIFSQEGPSILLN